MRHSSFIGFAATAFISVAVSLIAASLFLQPSPAVTRAAEPAATDAVEAFYAAANDAIATGNITALEAVVAPHFADRDPLPGMRPGREGLVDYLLALHAADPALTLVPEPILGSGDRAMARVSIQGFRTRPVLAGTIVERPAPWGAVDLFRIADGTIVERWTQLDGLTMARPLATNALDLALPARRQITLSRVSLDAGVNWNPAIPGDAVLYLEKGNLMVESGSPGASTSLSAGRSQTIAPGAGLTNLGREQAILLVATLSVPGLPGPASSPAPVLPIGVSSVVLAGDFASDVAAGPVTLELGQVTLAPRAGMMVSSADGPTLIALDAGEPEVTVWGRALRRRGRDDMSVTLKSAALTPGDGILLHPGSQLAIQNGDTEALLALVLAIRPGIS